MIFKKMHHSKDLATRMFLWLSIGLALSFCGAVNAMPWNKSINSIVSSSQPESVADDSNSYDTIPIDKDTLKMLGVKEIELDEGSTHKQSASSDAEEIIQEQQSSSLKDTVSSDIPIDIESKQSLIATTDLDEQKIPASWPLNNDNAPINNKHIQVDALGESSTLKEILSPIPQAKDDNLEDKKDKLFVPTLTPYDPPSKEVELNDIFEEEHTSKEEQIKLPNSTPHESLPKEVELNNNLEDEKNELSKPNLIPYDPFNRREEENLRDESLQNEEDDTEEVIDPIRSEHQSKLYSVIPENIVFSADPNNQPLKSLLQKKDYVAMMFYNIKNENPTVLSILIDLIGNTEEKNNNDETPLIYATKLSKHSSIKVLLSKGACRDVAINDLTLLEIAKKTKNLKVIELLK